MQEKPLTSRVIKTENIKLKTSIVSNRFAQPFYVWQDPADSVIYCLDAEQMKMSIDIPELDMIEFEGMFNTSDVKSYDPQSLADRFIIPPFSVFDTRQGYWQERKKVWNTLFDSQETRQDIELIAKSGQSSAIYELRNRMRIALGREPEWDEILAEAKKRNMHIYQGASVFDPALTEICYHWFCPAGGTILDPFAGGSVRGIVAGLLGNDYVGIDLREDQDPADLSNMTYEQFLQVYYSIIKKAIAKLKDNRFACFVVADIRDEKGYYRNFVSETIEAFRTCGMELYNEIILINVAGSLPIRVGRQFEAGRKVGKMHQNILVFYKGDPKKIREEFPEIKMEKYLQELNYQPNIALSVID